MTIIALEVISHLGYTKNIDKRNRADISEITESQHWFHVHHNTPEGYFTSYNKDYVLSVYVKEKENSSSSEE